MRGRMRHRTRRSRPERESFFHANGSEVVNLANAKAMLETGIPFIGRSGLRVLELPRGYVRCQMPFAGNGNHVGTMYAGAPFTLAELPGGALFLASFDIARYYPIVERSEEHTSEPQSLIRISYAVFC